MASDKSQHSNCITRDVLEVKEDKITAVVLLDMSAAFDLVDKNILIEKLKLYGLDGKSSKWMESYLSE